MVLPSIPPYSTLKKKIGTQYALDSFYLPNEHFTFLAYITLGECVTETGEGKPIYYLAVSETYKF